MQASRLLFEGLPLLFMEFIRDWQLSGGEYKRSAFAILMNGKLNADRSRFFLRLYPNPGSIADDSFKRRAFSGAHAALSYY
ncbi:hypothetical protein BROC_01797 [Candidatus Brocadiaceae bacterium]|nr:hypothetical protein BROC_01797 [Candidatus Brocadiaceae bacterium]